MSVMAELKRSDFSKICRTCLLQKDNMEPIYKSDIPKMLLSFTNIKVESDDDLPRLVCSDCIGKICECYEFKTQCEINEDILTKCILTSPSSPIPEKDDKKLSIKYEEIDKISSPAPSVKEDEIDYHNLLPFTSEEDEQSETENIVKVKKSRCKKNISDSCKYCKKKFVDQYVLKRHIENMHTKIRKKETCEICQRTVMCMKLHLRRKHNGEYKYKCRLCEEKFLYKSNLTEHIRLKHDTDKQNMKKERLLCTYCGNFLHSRKAYGYHMLSHKGEKPFQCSFCVKKFRSHNYLKIHERSHTDERPYPCTYCDRAFRDNSTLKGHIRTHTGEKPFVCPICNRGFAQRIAMKTHLKIH